MVEFIGEDGVILADQGRDGGQVGGKAGLEGDGRFHAFECCQAPFQLQVQVHRPGNRAHRCRANAIFIHRFLGSLHQARVVGQAQVIVRAKIQHPFAIHHQPGALRRAERADAVVQPGIFQALQLILDPFQFGRSSFCRLHIVLRLCFWVFGCFQCRTGVPNIPGILRHFGWRHLS